MPTEFVLDPNATLDYEFDWKPRSHGRPDARSDWLAAGETITSYTVTADPEDAVTLADGGQDDGIVKVWLSAVKANVTVTCHITTDAGRQAERSFQTMVRQR